MIRPHEIRALIGIAILLALAALLGTWEAEVLAEANRLPSLP